MLQSPVVAARGKSLPSWTKNLSQHIYAVLYKVSRTKYYRPNCPDLPVDS
jgi:hypothetical protein